MTLITLTDFSAPVVPTAPKALIAQLWQLHGSVISHGPHSSHTSHLLWLLQVFLASMASWFSAPVNLSFPWLLRSHSSLAFITYVAYVDTLMIQRRWCMCYKFSQLHNIKQMFWLSLREGISSIVWLVFPYFLSSHNFNSHSFHSSC